MAYRLAHGVQISVQDWQRTATFEMQDLNGPVLTFFDKNRNVCPCILNPSPDLPLPLPQPKTKAKAKNVMNALFLH